MHFIILVWTIPLLLLGGESLAGTSSSCHCPIPQLSEMAEPIQALEEKSKLHPKEERAIESGKKAITKELERKQKTAYQSFYREFQKTFKAYQTLFPEADSKEALLALRDPNLDVAMKMKIEELIAEKKASMLKHEKQELSDYQKGVLLKLNDKLNSSVEVLKGFSKAVWVNDAELEPVLVEAGKYNSQEDAKEREKVFEKYAEKSLNTPEKIEKIDALANQAYQDRKYQYLKGRPDFTAKQLKDFSAEIYIGSAINVDLGHPDFQGKSLQEISRIVEKKQTVPSFCFPRPATKEELRSKSSGEAPPNANLPPPTDQDPENKTGKVITETCDLSQSFGNNLDKLDEASLEKINQCLTAFKNRTAADGGPRCEHGIESVHATVEACSSTLRRVSGGTNFELTVSRAESMKDGFIKASERVLGLAPKVSGLNEENFNKYGNVVEGDPALSTGTCGPQPISKYNKEDWLTGALKENTNQCLVDVALPFQDCLRKYRDTPRNLWKCQPKDQKDALDGVLTDLREQLKDSIGEDASRIQAHIQQVTEKQDPYIPYRKASLKVQYLCKTPTVETQPKQEKKKGIANEERNWETPPELGTTCGVFMKCIPLRASIKTTHKPKDWGKTFEGLFRLPPGDGLIPFSGSITQCPKW